MFSMRTEVETYALERHHVCKKGRVKAFFCLGSNMYLAGNFSTLYIPEGRITYRTSGADCARLSFGFYKYIAPSGAGIQEFAQLNDQSDTAVQLTILIFSNPAE